MSLDLSALFNKAKKVTLVTVPKKEEPKTESLTIDKDPEQEQVTIAKPKKEKIRLEREHEDRSADNVKTVFVGNVPVGCTPKELKKLFSQFGTVEAVRLRNLIPLNPKHGKRLSFIKKELHPLQKTMTAFVRFSSQNEAKSATDLNGFLYKEHHLRVDQAHETQEDVKHDNKRSVFIGNLPFDVNDDDVWNAFQECGDIESVRIVRDRATSIGKGFGYVLFRDEASVGLAIKMQGNCKIGNRLVRVKAAVKKPKPIQSRSSSQDHRRPTRNIKSKRNVRSDGEDSVKQGRVTKRPAVKSRKEQQKKLKKHTSIKTNNMKKDVIQLKKKN